MLSTGLQWLRKQRRVLALAEGALRPHHGMQIRVSAAAQLCRRNALQTRGFAMPTAILSQMELLGRRYDELEHELSQYVDAWWLIT
jgi:hypothetical protein